MLRFIFSFLGSSFGIIKKVLLVFFVYALVVTLFAFFINKDRQNLPLKKTAPVKTVYSYINDPKLQKSPDGKIKIWLIKSMSCGVVGQACTNNPADDKKNSENSVAGNIGKLFAGAYMNPPASGIGWTYMALGDAGFVPKTYAWQGTGYAAITPFSPIWKLFRNISFSLLVLFVITLGFLIMFRAKLDPQAVVSIENSLPRVVVAMLMITFSFAIAGFLIDVMYVVIGLGISILKPYNSTGIFQDGYVYSNLGDIWSSIFPAGYFQFPGSGFLINPLIQVTQLGNAIMGLFPPLLGQSLNVVFGSLIGVNIVGFLNTAMGGEKLSSMFNNLAFVGISAGNLPQGPLSILISGIVIVYAIIIAVCFGVGFFIGLFILLTVVFLMFRIFFMLLFGYIRLLILIIFAPLILLFEAIPGQNTFSNWIKGMISELIMFPAVIMILMVGNIIISLPTDSVKVWQPPFINGISGENFTILVGMGLIFLIPDLVKTLKETIGAQPFPVQVGVGTYIGGAGAVGGAAFGTLQQTAAMSHIFPGIRNVLNTIPGLNRFTKDATTGTTHVKGAVAEGEDKTSEAAIQAVSP